jgi:AbiV family abortive infection protein
MTFQKNDLYLGSVLSAKNSDEHLKVAIILAKAKKFAAAFTSSVSAREEIGKARILFGIYHKMNLGEVINHDEINDAICKHQSKLKASLCGISVPIDDVLKSRFEHAQAQGDENELKLCWEQVSELASRQRKRLPDTIHSKRMLAQYINCRQDGSWSDPNIFTDVEIRNELLMISSEISNHVLALSNVHDVSRILYENGFDYNRVGSYNSENFMDIVGLV